MKPLWIELVDKGIANRFDLGDHELIEMNWRLTMYPELYRRVFQHEIGHSEGNSKAKDIMHDMKSTTPGLFHFISRNPSSWSQFYPIYWDRKRKQLVYDMSSIISYFLIAAISIGMIFLLRWLL